MAEKSIVKTQVRFEGFEQIKQRFAEIEADWRQKTSRMAQAGEKVGDGIAKSSKAATTAVKATGTIGVRSFGLMTTAARGFVSILTTSINVIANVGRAAIDIGAKLALVGAGSYGLARAWVTNTSKSVADMKTLAKSVGVSTEAFSQLSTAVRLAGGDTTDLVTGMQTLSDKIVDAAKNADGPAAAAFGQVGVSVRDAAGQLKTTEQLILEVADGLSKIDKDTLRASAAFDLFGSASTKLMPILKDGSRGLQTYMDQAKELGTEISDAQSDEANRLLAQQRRVSEAWRGLGFSVAEALLPAFTKSSDGTVQLITENNDRIAKWIAEKVTELQDIGSDFAKALGITSGSIERQWIRRLAPAMRTVLNIASDLFDMLNGKSATRLPWVNDLADAFWSAVGAAKAFGKAILGGAGADLPKIEDLAKNLKIAIDSLRNGLSGGSRDQVEMPWASKIGEVLRNLGLVVGVVAGTLDRHKEAITSVLAGISDAFKNFVVAVASILNGEAIPKDNPFAFLQPISDFVEKYGESIRSTFTNLLSDIGKAFDSVWGVFETFYGWLDSFAQMLGLRSGLQLGLIVFAAWFLGLTSIAQKVGTAMATVLFVVNGLFGLFGSVAKLFQATLYPVILKITRFIMTKLPVALTVGRVGLLAFGLTFGLVSLAITAVVAVLWYFRDEVWAVIKWVGSALLKIATGVVKAIWWPIDKLIGGLKRVGQWIGLIDEDKAVEPFEAAGERISDVADELTETTDEAYDKLANKAKASADESKKSIEGMLSSIQEKSKQGLGAVASDFEAVGEAATDAADESSSQWDNFWKDGELAADSATISAQRNLLALQKQYGLTAEQMKTALSGSMDGLSVDAKADVSAARIELRSIGHSIEDVAGSAKLIWSSAAEEIASKAQTAGSQIKAGFDEGLASAPAHVDALKAKISDLPADIQPDMEAVKNLFGDGLSGLEGEIAKASAAVPTGIADGVKTQSDAVREQVEDGWKSLPGYIQGQADSAGSAMKSLVDQTDTYQSQALSKMQASWTAFESYFQRSTSNVQRNFADLWESFLTLPELTFEMTVDAWGGLDDFFGTITGNVDLAFQTLWSRIKSGAADAYAQVRSIFGIEAAPVEGAADNSPALATGGIIRGRGTGTSDSIRAWLSNGEGVLNAAAVKWLGEDTVHALNNLMFPPAFATGGIVGGEKSMPSLGSLNLGVDGKRVATLYADDQAVRAVKRKMARSSQASQGARPRWAGGV